MGGFVVFGAFRKLAGVVEVVMMTSKSKGRPQEIDRDYPRSLARCDWTFPSHKMFDADWFECLNETTRDG